MLEKLRLANPELDILHVEDPQFARYGTLHPTIHLPEMRQVLSSVERTEFEHYVPCEERLRSLPEADQFKDGLFGQVPCQIGWYYGNCDRLNAVEYHKCSEVLYEYEDCVLILGLLWDMRDGGLDTSAMRVFYVPANTCVELYATTLHFAPCRAGQAPVMQIVAQSLGTNTPLLKPARTAEAEDRYLLQRNKWLLVHPEFAASEPEAAVGLRGKNLAVVPVASV